MTPDQLERLKDHTAANFGMPDLPKRVVLVADLQAMIEAYEAQREVLESLTAHHTALAGPEGHRLGCECGGTSDGEHCCAGFEAAFVDAKSVLAS